MNRRNFLRLGALFVPAAVVEPRRVYSFIWAKETPGERLARDIKKTIDRSIAAALSDLRRHDLGHLAGWEIDRSVDPPRLVARMTGNLHSIVISGTVSI